MTDEELIAAWAYSKPTDPLPSGLGSILQALSRVVLDGKLEDSADTSVPYLDHN